MPFLTCVPLIILSSVYNFRLMAGYPEPKTLFAMVCVARRSAIPTVIQHLASHLAMQIEKRCSRPGSGYSSSFLACPVINLLIWRVRARVLGTVYHNRFPKSNSYLNHNHNPNLTLIPI